jgi:hypothetical protein
MPFKSQPEAMAAFYKTHLECTVWKGDECLAEKYLIEAEDGEWVMEEDITEDAEYVQL